jgi:hypothetical protein
VTSSQIDKNSENIKNEGSIHEDVNTGNVTEKPFLFSTLQNYASHYFSYKVIKYK